MKSLIAAVNENRVPHAILLTGAAGCGKTSIGRILKKKLKCADFDFREINAADARGIDAIREINAQVELAPMGGACRMWLLDEVAKLTSDAQTALLKTLEDTPSHVYFVLCTTDPQRLLTTIHSRCTTYHLKPLGVDHMRCVLKRVIETERLSVTAEIVDLIVEVSDGSARKALVHLEAAGRLATEEEQRNAIQEGDSKHQAIEIARALMRPDVKWTEVAKLIRECDEDAEGIRRLILGYAAPVLLSKASQQAAAIISAFRDDYYSCGKAGLALSAWEVLSSRK